MSTSSSRAVHELFDLTGRTALVTGASGNIGQAIARRLAEAGAVIIAHYHNNELAARKLIEQIGSGSIVQANLCDESGVDAIFEKTQPDLVVNNAATQPVQALADMSLGDWRDVQATNIATMRSTFTALSW